MASEGTQPCQVKFLPDEKVTFAPGGTTLAETAGRAGVFIALPCGGRGACGKCVVKVLEGELSPPTEAEIRNLGEERIREGFRLACQARVMGAATVEVPPERRALERKEIGLLLSREFTIEPAVRSCMAEVPGGSIGDQRSDLERLRSALPDDFQLPCSLAALRHLPASVRAAGGSVKVVASEDRILDVLPASRPGGVYGAAVDLGTTTVVGYLFDLEGGRYLASAASYNPQAQHGADVISRINHAMSISHGLSELHGEAVGVVNEVIGQAAGQAGVSVDEVYEVVVVGNTCMHHLFLGLDPRHLGQSPYVPAISEMVTLPARRLGVNVHRAARVVVLPVIAGFVGADTVGVILATDLTSRPRPILAIDIGTNGEVALWTGERLLVASCAAGPAFEGAQIHNGVRARPGAIERVEVRDGDLAVRTIGGMPAVGICGSGLFDAVAVLLELGLIDTTGRLAEPDGLPAPLARRVVGEGRDKRIVLVSASDSADGRAIVLTQGDVRQVQLAKAAIRAAVELLLAEAGLEATDVGEVLLAGAFGNYVNPHSILRMGLLPRTISAERVHGVGNAAGAGAAMALLSMEARRKAVQIAEEATHLELFTSGAFQDVFADSMLFV